MSLENMHELLTLADWYTHNDKEAMKITGTTSAIEASRDLSAYFNTFVIKQGANGCLLCSQGGHKLIPPLPGVIAVDSTGAGDAFCPASPTVSSTAPTRKPAPLYGNITGGTCVQAVGCQAAFVNEQEMLAKAEWMWATAIP